MGKYDCTTSSSAAMAGVPKRMLKQEPLLLCNAVWFVLQLKAQRGPCSPPPTTPSTLHLIYVSSQRLSADLVPVWAPVPLSALRTGAFHYNSAKKPTEIRNKTEPILSLFRLHFNCLLLHFLNYIFLLIWLIGKQRQQYFHQNQGSGDGR